jgi:hypothetical protein
MAGYFPDSPHKKYRVNRLDRREYEEICQLKIETDMENSCDGACLRGLLVCGGGGGEVESRPEIRITYCGF